MYFHNLYNYLKYYLPYIKMKFYGICIAYVCIHRHTYVHTHKEALKNVHGSTVYIITII